MTETSTQISVYDALLTDEPTILTSVRNATNGLLTQSFAFVNGRASTDYLKAVRAFLDALGFPEPGEYVFLDKSDRELDNIFGLRSSGSLLDALHWQARQRVSAALDNLAVTGAQIANFGPRTTYALALADLEADLGRVAP
jgi:hypothetical protein